MPVPHLDPTVVAIEPVQEAPRQRQDDLAGLAAAIPGQTELAAHAEHIERLKAWQALDLPSGIERSVHQNRLLKIAREGGQMTPADLAKFEPQRRYATLVALTIPP